MRNLESRIRRIESKRTPITASDVAAAASARLDVICAQFTEEEHRAHQRGLGKTVLGQQLTFEEAAVLAKAGRLGYAAAVAATITDTGWHEQDDADEDELRFYLVGLARAAVVLGEGNPFAKSDRGVPME